MLLISLIFTGYWLLLLVGTNLGNQAALFRMLETYKYLGAELLAALLLWVFFTGRGYCYYCPLGTVLALIGKIVNQRIVTNKSKCIDCGKCDSVCPMTIEIRKKAIMGNAVTDDKCVGCGHCIDSCPTNTLQYTTMFFRG